MCVCVRAHGAAWWQDRRGSIVKCGSSDGARMEFYQKDPQQGVHLVTVLNSPGGYAQDGLHYFNAHQYLVPGRFTVRFGLNGRGKRRFGRVRKVSYETVVRDPGTPPCCRGCAGAGCSPLTVRGDASQSWKKLRLRWHASPL